MVEGASAKNGGMEDREICVCVCVRVLCFLVLLQVIALLVRACASPPGFILILMMNAR